MSQLEVVRVPYLEVEGVTAPVYATDGAAGFDIYAAESGIIPADTVVGIRQVIKDGKPVFEECGLFEEGVIRPKIKKQPVQVSTKLRLEIPNGFEVEIRGRSGLAFKHCLMPHNGTIDSDYRGEIKILIYNLGEEDYHFEKGERIAQGVLKRYARAEFVPVKELSQTVRNEGGMGHTGRK